MVETTVAEPIDFIQSMDNEISERKEVLLQERKSIPMNILFAFIALLMALFVRVEGVWFWPILIFNALSAIWFARTALSKFDDLEQKQDLLKIVENFREASVDEIYGNKLDNQLIG